MPIEADVVEREVRLIGFCSRLIGPRLTGGRAILRRVPSPGVARPNDPRQASVAAIDVRAVFQLEVRLGA